MGIVNMATYEAALQGLQAYFIDQLAEQIPPGLATISMEAPSSAPSEMYTWLDDVGDMEDWIGDRTIEDLSLLAQTLVNVPYQKAVSVSKRDLANDRLGLAKIKMANLAQLVNRQWWRLTIEALLEGATRLCHDGQPFFAAAHPVPGTALVNNNWTNAAFGAVSFAAGRAQLGAMLGGGGSVLECEATHIVYGDAIEATVESVIGVQRAAGGADNPDYHRVERIKAKRIRAGYVTRGGTVLTGNEWFLLDCSRPIKPIVRQVRKATELAWDEPFKRNTISAGVDNEGAAGMTLYMLAQGNFAP